MFLVNPPLFSFQTSLGKFFLLSTTSPLDFRELGLGRVCSFQNASLSQGIVGKPTAACPSADRQRQKSFKPIRFPYPLKALRDSVGGSDEGYRSLWFLVHKLVVRIFSMPCLVILITFPSFLAVSPRFPSDGWGE